MKFLKTVAPAALTELWEKVSGNVVPKDTDADVGIGTDDPQGKIDVQSGNMTAIFGADGGATTLSDNTNKANRIALPHYDTDEEPVVFIHGASQSSANILELGGGTGTGNAFTEIRFRTGANTTTTTGSQRMVIDSGGNVTVSTGNLVIGTAGKGIDFSAQTATATGTTTAELLDHYETGTWTAAFAAATSGTITISTSYDTGLYTRIGRKVHVQGLFLASAVSSPVGILTITGLPFTSVDSTDLGSDWSALSVWGNGLTSAEESIQGRMGPSATALEVTGFNGTHTTDLAGKVGVSTYFIISFTYTV